MTLKTISTLAAVARPKFLLLVPASVFPGIATAFHQVNSLQMVDILLVLMGALMAHVGVNVLNEYQDFRSGLDMTTQKTPFSGGSGKLPAYPEMAPAARTLAAAALALSGAVGVYFSISSGPLIWIPAGAGLLIIVFYTGFLNRHPLLCLIAPGTGFGSCMVLGTHYALSSTYTLQAFCASLIPFFLVNNLLLLNQFPDVDADTRAGRRHYPIVIGRTKSALIFLGFLAASYLTIVLCVSLGVFPRGALLGLLTIPAAVPMQLGIFRYANTLERLAPFMGLNVMVTLMTPVLMAAGMLFLF
jgi:1,4-dihydroxy-2-naphthoate polyprenyltransferase